MKKLCTKILPLMCSLISLDAVSQSTGTKIDVFPSSVVAEGGQLIRFRIDNPTNLPIFCRQIQADVKYRDADQDFELEQAIIAKDVWINPRSSRTFQAGRKETQFIRQNGFPAAKITRVDTLSGALRNQCEYRSNFEGQSTLVPGMLDSCGIKEANKLVCQSKSAESIGIDAGQASFDIPEKSAPLRYFGPIGNHEGVSLRLYRDDEGVVLHSDRVGFASSRYLNLHFSGPYIEAYEVHSNVEGEKSRIYPHHAEFKTALEQMRARIAFVAKGGDRYDWGMAPERVEVVNPSVMPLLFLIDQELEKITQPTANCILYEDAIDPLQGKRLGVTAGVYGNLGEWNDRAQYVWVRDGYKLRVNSEAQFAKLNKWEMQSYEEYSENFEAGEAINGGRLIRLSRYSKDVSSLFCTAEDMINQPTPKAQDITPAPQKFAFAGQDVMLVSMASQKCLNLKITDLADPTGKDTGKTIHQWGCPSQNSEWTNNYFHLFGNDSRYVRLRSLFSNKCVTQNGSKPVQRECDVSDSYSFHQTETNTYTITHVKTGLCLTSQGFYDGASVGLEDCSGLDDQKWRIDSAK